MGAVLRLQVGNLGVSVSLQSDGVEVDGVAAAADRRGGGRGRRRNNTRVSFFESWWGVFPKVSNEFWYDT